MRRMKWVIVVLACLSSVCFSAGQQVLKSKSAAHLDTERERHALQSLSRVVEKEITSAVEAMPADKFGFALIGGGEVFHHFTKRAHAFEFPISWWKK